MEQLKITEILEEYQEDKSIFSKETDQFRRIKSIIWHNLSDVERRILLLYAERGNMRDTASELNVSPSTICIYINNIRQKIKNLL